MTGAAYAGGGGSYVGMRVIESAHADLATTTDYIARQWVSTSAGITTPSYTISNATYVVGDENGTVTNYEGLTNDGSGWVQQPDVNDGAKTFGAGATTTFGVVTAGVFAVLPIELLSFGGECVDNVISFSWVTGMEINNDYFEILANEQGGEYESVGFIDGAGNSLTPIAYDYDCSQCLEKDYQYYKLRQVDEDGVMSNFDAVHISCAQQNSFMIYPTLVEDQRQVLFSGFDFSKKTSDVASS